jgi:hypothetical protein
MICPSTGWMKHGGKLLLTKLENLLGWIFMKIVLDLVGDRV